MGLLPLRVHGHVSVPPLGVPCLLALSGSLHAHVCSPARMLAPCQVRSAAGMHSHAVGLRDWAPHPCCHFGSRLTGQAAHCSLFPPTRTYV